MNHGKREGWQLFFDKPIDGLCDIIVFKRLTLPLDLNVVRDYFKGKDPRFVEIVKALPGLANDEGLMYFPLRLPEPIRFKVAPRKTPHVAETPTLELKEVAALPELTAMSKELTEYFKRLIREKIVERDELGELRSRVEELQEELEARDKRIEELEHDLELAQRFRIELPPELLRIPGFTEKVEYLERQLMGLYQAQIERAQRLEEENRELKARIEATHRRVDFSDAVKRLETIREEIMRSNKALAGFYESCGDALDELGSTITLLNEFSKGFVSKAVLDELEKAHKRELEDLRRTCEARLEALERAEDWRLNPSVIVRMSRVVNELNQFTDTGRQVLKAAATMDPGVRFSEDQMALSIGRSPSTARQYLKQLAGLGWVKQVGGEFQNNIDGSLAGKLREAQRPGREPIPCIVIERCRKELQTFIHSL